MERCVRVLDGAVVILDGVAGVEAQTETVWRQANRNNIPRILFVNKMDRDGAALMRSVREVERRLVGRSIGAESKRPVVLQWPIVLDGSAKVNGPGSGGKGLEGIVDLITMETLYFNEDPNGSVIKRTPIKEYAATGTNNSDQFQLLHKECIEARETMVEALCEADDELLNIYLGSSVDGDSSKLPLVDVNAAVRRATLAGKIVPVLLGASFRNMGVQPLMDGIVNYLPSPVERPPPTAHHIVAVKGDKSVSGKKSASSSSIPASRTISMNDKQTFALAFKVVHDPRRGPLVFVRVYSGEPPFFQTPRSHKTVLNIHFLYLAAIQVFLNQDLFSSILLKISRNELQSCCKCTPTTMKKFLI